MKTKKKTLLLVAENSLFGGITRYTLNASIFLKNHPTYQIHSACLVGPEGKSFLHDETQKNDIFVHDIIMKSSFDPNAFRQVKRLVLTLQPEIVLTQGYRANLIFWISKLKYNLPGLFFDRQAGIPLKFTKRLLVYFGFDLLLKNICSDYTIAVSDDTKQRLLSFGRFRNRVITMHNPIPLPSDTLVAKPSNQREIINLGFAARVVEEKGVKELIQAYDIAFKRNARLRLHVAGDGELLPYLKEETQKNKLSPYVTFYGKLNDLSEFYKKLDIFLLPSYDEGLPFSLLEAMSYGVPGIASKVGGTPEIIIENENGKLIPSRNAQALADEILRFSSPSVDLAKMGIQARNLIRSKYSFDSYFAKLFSLTHQLKH